MRDNVSKSMVSVNNFNVQSNKINVVKNNENLKDKTNIAEVKKEENKQDMPKLSGAYLKAVFMPNAQAPIKQIEKNKEFIRDSFDNIDEKSTADLAKMMVKNENKQSLNDLINFVIDGDIPPYCISSPCTNAYLQDNIKNDIQMLKTAKEQNIPPQDLMVKNYDSSRAGVNNSKVGDVFSVGDEKNVYIKTDENSSKQLKFDKETYFKLFPPVERFAMNQSQMGDCYLISTLDNLYQDNETRVKILDCFEQDGDNLKVKVPNDKNERIIENYCIKGNDALQNYDNYHFINGADGIKLLEDIFGDIQKNRFITIAKDQTYDKIDDTVSNQMKKEEKSQFLNDQKQTIEDKKQRYRAELKYLQNGGNIPEKAGFTREERIDFIQGELKKLVGESISNTKLTKSQEKDTPDNFMKQINRKNELYKQINNPDGIWLKDTHEYDFDRDEETYYFSSRPIIGEDENGVILESQKNIKNFSKHFGDNRTYYRGNGGVTDFVYDKFGMKSRFFMMENQGEKDKFSNLIKEKLDSNNSDFLISGLTDYKYAFEGKGYEDYNIVGAHIYSIKPQKNQNGDIEYAVVNPWNTAYKVVMTEKQLFRYFSDFNIADK